MSRARHPTVRHVLKGCVSNTPVQSGCGFHEFHRLHESKSTLGRHGQERPCVELRPRCARISRFATGRFRCPQLTSFSRKGSLRSIPRRPRDADEAYDRLSSFLHDKVSTGSCLSPSACTGRSITISTQHQALTIGGNILGIRRPNESSRAMSLQSTGPEIVGLSFEGAHECVLM